MNVEDCNSNFQKISGYRLHVKLQLCHLCTTFRTSSQKEINTCGRSEWGDIIHHSYERWMYYCTLTTFCFIKPCDQDGPAFSLEAIIIPKVYANQAKVHISPQELTHIYGLKLADHKFHQPGPIVMLMGAEWIPFFL